MSMSGVTVKDECLTEFNDLKMKKVKRFATFRISEDKKSIICDPDRPAQAKSASPREDFEAFKAMLPANEPRYCIFDFEFDTQDGTTARVHNKLIFVPWTPDDSNIKLRMLYASSKDALKKKFVGVATEIQANEIGDLVYEEICERCL